MFRKPVCGAAQGSREETLELGAAEDLVGGLIETIVDRLGHRLGQRLKGPGS